LNNSIDATTNCRFFGIVTHILNEEDFKATNVEMVSGSNFIPLPFHLFKFAITYERF